MVAELTSLRQAVDAAQEAAAEAAQRAGHAEQEMQAALEDRYVSTQRTFSRPITQHLLLRPPWWSSLKFWKVLLNFHSRNKLTNAGSLFNVL